MELEWFGDDENGWSAENWAATVAEVKYAHEGEAEGGLGSLIRFMAGAQGLSMPAPSPAGWYWQGTISARGVWCAPQGPHATPDEAKEAANVAFRRVERCPVSGDIVPRKVPAILVPTD